MTWYECKYKEWKNSQRGTLAKDAHDSPDYNVGVTLAVATILSFLLWILFSCARSMSDCTYHTERVLCAPIPWWTVALVALAIAEVITHLLPFRLTKEGRKYWFWSTSVLKLLALSVVTPVATLLGMGALAIYGLSCDVVKHWLAVVTTIGWGALGIIVLIVLVWVNYKIMSRGLKKK